MTWTMHHSQSEKYASFAAAAVKERDTARAIAYYKLAAEQETLALGEIVPTKKRTIGITTVSAASLWFKAHDLQQAQNIAYVGLSTKDLPSFAVKQLKDLLQEIWGEESRQEAGIDFTEGQVLISVSGGEIVTGGAPLGLILDKVGEVSRIFYRTIEMLLDRPFRKRGGPSLDIQEQFRPWLFQAPAGSYQFAVRVERPKQMTLFPGSEPEVDQITQRFLQVVRASADDPQGELLDLVPNREYRDTFVKLTRNLAPTGKVFGQLEIKAPGITGSRPIVLTSTSREVINRTIKRPVAGAGEPPSETEVRLRGTLRGLELNSDWLEINIEGQDNKPIKIFETGDVIDDIVGPMVNRRVIVDVVQKPGGRYAYRDIQLEE